MKKTNFIKAGILALVLGIVAISCSKKDTDPQPTSAANTVPDQAKVIEVLKNMKFSFSDPSSGNFQYSSTEGYRYVEPETGVTYSEPASATYNGVEVRVAGNVSKGGGSFEVDGKSIELDYVLCFTGDANSDMADAFGTIPKGFSMLIGIAGDIDFSGAKEPKLDYLVIAYVNEEKANGKYDIIFQDDQDNATGKFSFVVVQDLTKAKDMDDTDNLKMYLSTGGSLDFSNGNIGLNNVEMVEVIDNKAGKKIPAEGTLSCE